MIGFIAFILTLGVIVLVHELGHFIAAKRAGAAVEEFGFGFPPRIAGFRRGGTIYSLNWIPVGGFVRIKGESGTDNAADDSFSHKSARRRAVVLAAGVTMNVLLAAVLFAVSYTIGAPAVVDGVGSSAHVRDVRVQIIRVLPGSAAADAGIVSGDIVRSINGAAVTKVEEVQEQNGQHVDQPLSYELERGAEPLHLSVTPRASPENGQRGIIGVELVETGTVSYPFTRAIWEGIRATGTVIAQTAIAFVSIVAGLFRGQNVGADVTGPIGIAVLTTQVARLGISHLLQFAALLSINIAIINVLPIPALDGGRMLFLVIEKIRGRALNARIESLIHNIGFALLLVLVAIITIRDVRTFSASIGNFFQQLTGGGS
ncbi:MAG: RIP metalloprotease RseP [Candidatus Kerfeldbacteria bacterium]|nr:RIP metalloprotease RseP [Candidatus Kerfeldbacteria bacterium]